MSCEAKCEYLFIWKIENYSFCPQKNKNFITSTLFSTENIGDSVWFLILYPEGVNKESDGHASLYIKRLNNDIRADVNDIDIKIDIARPDGSVLQSKTIENASIARGGVQGWRKFFNIQEMTQTMESWKDDTLVIQCSLANRKQLICEARTKIDVHHCIFKWNVKLINGPIPIPPIQREFCLCDTLQFDIKLAASGDNIKLSVSRKDDIFVPKISCRLSLLDINGAEVVSKRISHTFGEQANNVWEFPNFITVKYLKDNKNNLLSNGIFTLLFEFSSSKEKQPVTVYKSICNSSTEKYNIICLREDLQEMYRTKLHSDIELQIGDQQFHAHKSILSAPSPVFKAMFDQDMLESQTGVVNIPDVDPKDFELFLESLYTATFEDMDYETALKLIILADKYQISSLRFDCSQVLRSSLCVNNVCEVLSLADMITYAGLKAFVINYIADHAKEILTSSEWMNWSEKNIKLATEVISSIAINFEVVPKKSHK